MRSFEPSKKGMTLIEIMIGVAIIAIILTGIYQFFGNNYKEACAETGGRAVFNGQYYECLIPKELNVE